MVDHFTESQVNCATVLSDKTQQDSIDVQVVSVLRHVQLGHTPRPWKRDVTKNFRGTTIAQRRLPLLGSIQVAALALEGSA